MCGSERLGTGSTVSYLQEVLNSGSKNIFMRQPALNRGGLKDRGEI